MLVLRPSRDLGRLAGDYEPRLPRVFRFLTRGLGTRKTASPDILSLVMFQQDYLRRLIELGEEDVHRQWERIQAFLERGPRGDHGAPAPA
jgi:NTE family protein